ncbi:MAG: (2Fe-2S)-binding protein [Pseudomonadota bacterium]|nr:(2Fe-2S)-binding protein [Pseudomonadota bacterium]
MARQDGEWIDRNQPLHFVFEGKTYSGFVGDTISSAIAASGNLFMGRSFKYHRPRGILSMSNHDINTMMQDDQDPTIRADVVLAQNGMQLRTVNTFGGLKSDRGRYMNCLSRFLPAGFYYKTFHTPKWLFPMWEKMFRTLTGLGEVNFDTPRRYTAKRYAFADVLVIGSGPSGLSAALAAAKAGAQVVVVDENVRPGGSLTYDYGGMDESPALLGRLLSEVTACEKIEIWAGTLAAGYYSDNWIALVDDQRMTKMRAKTVVVASGSYEQPCVFRNNDLPGVMMASAAQRLLRRYAVRVGRNFVVLTSNSAGYRAALDMVSGGASVAAIVDMRPEGELSHWHELAAGLGIRILAGHCIYEAIPEPGRYGVSAAVVKRLSSAGEIEQAGGVTFSCDAILMAVGYAPAANLLYQAGTKMRYSHEIEQFVPDLLPESIFACGRVNGVYTLSSRLLDGERAGLEAAQKAGYVVQQKQVDVPAEPSGPTHPYPIISHPKGMNFVDFDEDLHLRDFYVSVQEAFDNIELMKRFTTVGMGPSQGKHSNMNAIRILARLKGKNIDEIGTTTARPFFHPVKLSHLAGKGFTPERLTPMHHRHQELGAVFMDAGNWKRPEYYQIEGLSRIEAIRQEVRSVRTNVGMIDVGTLGKIEIFGPDAVLFIERMYTGLFAKQAVGTTRYALGLDETGVVIDDGVVGRLAQEHFFVTTTTTGSAQIYREMNRWALLWKMNVGIVNATGYMAAMNLAGPKSRAVLAPHCNIDVSDASVPYLALRTCEIGGVSARIMRVGFVGELGYEIHVPSEKGAYVWDLLMQEGQKYGIQPFGVEAQRILRLEKGHIIVSQDTDGLTNPFDAACGWAVKMNKPFFIGQRSLKIAQATERKQVLAGFALAENYRGELPKESHLLIEAGDIAGRITSITDSEALGRVIGLCFVRPDLNEIGRMVQFRLSDGALVPAQIVATPFYDPDGMRQKV